MEEGVEVEDVRTAPPAGLPSTLGGTGWLPRTLGHREEVAAGSLWARCGYRSEVAVLREVLLSDPPRSLASVGDAGAQLMTDPVDPGLLREQSRAIAEAYRRHGVTVHLTSPPSAAPPNVIFLRDLFLVTPEGAVLGRTASRQRAGEERHAALALAELGIPILRTVTGTATFEGADALWVDERTVLVGCGFRTNREGFDVVRECLRHQGVEAVAVPLGPGVQHLLGSVVFVDHRRAVLHRAAATGALRRELSERGYSTVELDPDDEVVRRRAMNFVTLAPGRILMPAGCPHTRRALEGAGIAVDTVEVGEYVKAAGALGCLTGVLRRGEEDGRDAAALNRGPAAVERSAAWRPGS
ncbi:dimethylarginine dimethylaminohydrolase family protein [Streptomyces sp. NPDC060053]|uniref:dimethylarginine dimethylaminohydrolase family protein n=1 Tax=Streptomyces sp. NPDC060053 TaxID=3347047 RepID=UPI0036CF63E2